MSQRISQQNIRNFCIIAHVDHGKSTLSDRFIEQCGAITQRERKAQILDDLDLERERGITIKARSVALPYTHNNEKYLLNLIDTPGHVDFAYEVQRSLSACEGALLLVDATQGVQAQTVANCYSAVELDLEILPIINKIDVISADPEAALIQLEEIVGIDTQNAMMVSGKSGEGVDELLRYIVENFPAPEGEPDGTTRILITDSWFDPYLGVLSSVRVKDGECRKGAKLKTLSNGYECVIEECGVFTPFKKSVDCLRTGEVGFVSYGIKDIRNIPVGDTLVDVNAKGALPVAQFVAPKPMVFSSIFPQDGSEFSSFRQAFERFLLSDAAVTHERISIDSLGQGYRCGFLGTLHMEVVLQRLEKEWDLDLISTTPSVEYKVELKNGTTMVITNPSDIDDVNKIQTFFEPMAETNIFIPQDYIGRIIEICSERRGQQKSMRLSAGKATLVMLLPMSELMGDFFERVKAVSHGYGTVDYQLTDYQEANIKCMNILINGSLVTALAELVHIDKIRNKGLKIVENLQRLIPRQMFDVAIQAAANGKVIARSNVKALRKNVTAKCYGGDITRKKKLLEKQKKGKRHLRAIGNIQVPKEIFTQAKINN